MDYFTTTSAASRQKAGCLIVGIYESGLLSAAAAEIDTATGGAIKRLAKSGDLSGELGECRTICSLKGVRADRVVIAGLGQKEKFGVAEFRQAMGAAVRAFKGSKVYEVVNYLTIEDVKAASAYYLARYTVESIGNGLYDFEEMKSNRKNVKTPINRIGVALKDGSERSIAKKGAEHADAIVTAMTLAKDLGNLPPNICTPTYLARTAERLARQHDSIRTQVINEAAMKRLNMHSLLSVSNGSAEPAKLIVMQYKGGDARDKPVVLVGKGITFDSGGISLKPGPAMDEMKYDMCGAAAVIATVAAIANLKLPINVNAIVPSSENLPSGTATRPGDIVTSMSGLTIEILNTDAEGRLVLCDAITYSRRFKPSVIIDVATLTGACVIALGHHRTAIMSNNDELARSIASAGDAADDRGWHMPLGEEYAQQLKSNFADFANVGGREGGAITAAAFLGKFTEGLDWAHLDIAGTAWVSGSKKGATGRPVPMLTEFLLQRAGALP
ncbi:MAG TPA: leucyl aminopeptidase [Woeseiaceae bacterium]|nr:leucyl aminopeptidase [Woeseiaceae bacterium]